MPPKKQAQCADWSKEHSNAPRPCVWLAMLRLDYHSLLRQREEVMASVLEQHLKRPLSEAEAGKLQSWKGPKGWYRDRLQYIIAALAIVHSPSNRCARMPLEQPSESPRASLGLPAFLPTLSSGGGGGGGDDDDGDGSCGPVSAYDVSTLPYRWLPGLPVPQPTRAGGTLRPDAVGTLLSVEEAHQAERLEVTHLADYWPGPVWLYHAPGSGAWWSPGPRRAVANNLIDAILRFHSMETVVARLKWVEKGDRRVARFRAWLQWRVAYADYSWEQVLQGAAQGNITFAPFASAGELLGALLTEQPPKDIDSLILVGQMHFWPRGPGWALGDEGYAPTMVAPCAGDRREGRTHVVPELVDFRAMRENKRGKHGTAWRASRDIPRALYSSMTADREGRRSCAPGIAGNLCTSCSPSALAQTLCECALVPARDDSPGRRRAKSRAISALTRPGFDAVEARRCCQTRARRFNGTWGL